MNTELIEMCRRVAQRWEGTDVYNHAGQLINMLCDEIEHMAADKESAQHGRWVFDGEGDYAKHYHCDKCGAWMDVRYGGMTNYCPKCGAKMDGGEAPAQNRRWILGSDGRARGWEDRG